MPEARQEGALQWRQRYDEEGDEQSVPAQVLPVRPILLATSPLRPASPPSPRPCSDVVFMLGLPTRLDSYVHVAGRTAREGRKGHAISLLTSPQQEERFAQYKSELGLKAEVIDLRFLS